MFTALRKLKDNERGGDSRSFAIETLFRSLIVDNGLGTEESKLDFVMDDGIDMVTRAIVESDCSTLHIVQGFQILFAIAEDSRWHWQSVFDGIGGIDGIITLLEHHRMDMTILSKVIFMLSKLSDYGVHRFQEFQIMRWLSFFDLILEGVEENVRDVETFKSFCLYMRADTEKCPPHEVHGRILACVGIGLRVHREDSECQRLGESILLRFLSYDTMESTNQNRSTAPQNAPFSTNRRRKRGTIASSFSSGYSRCAPAA